MSKSNEQILRQFLSLWKTREAEAMADMFAPAGIYDNVPFNRPMNGRDAILEWLDNVFEQLTRIDVEILHIATDGEWVLCERIDDHVVGDKHMPLPVMNATRIIDGKIHLFRDYFCRQTVSELGMG